MDSSHSIKPENRSNKTLYTLADIKLEDIPKVLILAVDDKYDQYFSLKAQQSSKVSEPVLYTMYLCNIAQILIMFLHTLIFCIILPIAAFMYFRSCSGNFYSRKHVI